MGIQLTIRAMSSPLVQIVKNAGEEAAVVLEKFSDSIATERNVNISNGGPMTISIWAKLSSVAKKWDELPGAGFLVQLGNVSYVFS
jgi:chaperonin GroEL (HSP60 family)